MPDPRHYYSTVTIKVNGKLMSDPPLNQIDKVVVEQNLHLPDAVAISFRDSASQIGQSPLNLGLVDQNVLPIGSELEIAMGRDAEPAVVFSGEVTAHEIDIDVGEAPRLVVRAYDRAHRLQRGRKSRTFTNMTDADIVTHIARECGLQAAVESTSQVYAYVAQHNQTNWEFLLGRAKRIGYDLYVKGTSLNFAKPKVDAAPAGEVELWKNLQHLRLRMSSSGQVNDVTVQSWDPQQKQSITGHATRGTTTARGGQQKSGAQLAQPFGEASMVLTRHPVRSQAEADTLAKAVADDLAASAMQLEMTVFGKPEYAPGRMVRLSALGDRFSGEYYVTGVTHRIGHDQTYVTDLNVSGRRGDTLRELVSTTQGGERSGPLLAVGQVTNNGDETQQGRVKLSFPWLTGVESNWARVVAPGAGKKRGFYWLPEVGDEVLVAFEQGDVNQPYVLGGLWNGQDLPPRGNSDVTSNGAVNQHIMQSRSGHVVVLDDTAGAEKISIVDKSGNNSITIETASNKITISAKGDLELNAVGDVKVTGANISLKAKQNCAVEGTAGEASLKGLTGTVQAQTNLAIKATAACQISGMPIALN